MIIICTIKCQDDHLNYSGNNVHDQPKRGEVVTESLNASQIFNLTLPGLTIMMIILMGMRILTVKMIMIMWMVKMMRRTCFVQLLPPAG